MYSHPYKEGTLRATHKSESININTWGCFTNSYAYRTLKTSQPSRAEPMAGPRQHVFNEVWCWEPNRMISKATAGREIYTSPNSQSRPVPLGVWRQIDEGSLHTLLCCQTQWSCQMQSSTAGKVFLSSTPWTDTFFLWECVCSEGRFCAQNGNISNEWIDPLWSTMIIFHMYILNHFD